MELIAGSQLRILDRVKKWYMSSILSYTQINFSNKKSINMKYFLEWMLYVKTVLKKMFIYTWANPTVIQLKNKISLMKQCLTIKQWWGTYKLQQSRNNAHDL